MEGCHIRDRSRRRRAMVICRGFTQAGLELVHGHAAQDEVAVLLDDRRDRARASVLIVTELAVTLADGDPGVKSSDASKVSAWASAEYRETSNQCSAEP